MSGVTDIIAEAEMKMQMIKEQVDNNTMTIGVLNGDENTMGSVAELAAKNTVIEGKINTLNQSITDQTIIVG